MDSTTQLTFFSFISIIVLAIVYFFLITEKINKVIVAILGASVLIISQVFRSLENSSQENALSFVSRNLDVLGFVIGMMILVGIIRQSGIFEALAIWLVKMVKGNPFLLLIVFGYLTLGMTTFLSNIPTILILTPVLLVLVKELKLPHLPYLFIMVAMANIGGAMTPLSDPTTYYQAKTVGLSFMEVISNSGLIVIILSVVVCGYVLLIFRKQLAGVTVSSRDISLFQPQKAIKNRRILYLGIPILITAISLMVLKEYIYTTSGITLDNATITLSAAFFSMLIFHEEPQIVFKKLVDWEIIFFFIGLFIIVGGLEFTQIIDTLSHSLIQLTKGNETYLLLLITTATALLSVFIDNVPLNITLVGAIQTMAKSGIYVYPLWWALNLGTSIGGFGSPIAAACNVIVFGQAQRENMKVDFKKYLIYALPLVIINSLITFFILALRYQ